MIIGIALEYESCPFSDSACNMPTEAADDWIIAVITAPARTPSSGFENILISCANSGTSFSPETASVIICIPYIRNARPNSIDAVSDFFESFLNTSSMIIAANAMIGVNVRGFKNCTHISSLLTPISDIIHDVTDVPRFAPIIMPIACPRFRMPEFTNPTTITVVVADDWITAVITTPSRNPLNLVEVAAASRVFSFPPAFFSRP